MSRKGLMPKMGLLVAKYNRLKIRIVENNEWRTPRALEIIQQDTRSKRLMASHIPKMGKHTHLQNGQRSHKKRVVGRDPELELIHGPAKVRAEI